MPPVRPITSNPITRIGQITNDLDFLAVERSGMENNLLGAAVGRPMAPAFSFTEMVQNSYLMGLLKTFFSFWINEAKYIMEAIKNLFPLSDRPK